MSNKITTSIRRALRSDKALAHHVVHFHYGPAGQLRPCDRDRCDSPGISTRELGA